jgi:hypothetical protein
MKNIQLQKTNPTKRLSTQSSRTLKNFMGFAALWEEDF